jgi:hypothetical protein
VAVCQVLEKRIGRMPVVARVNRGPLFLEESPSPDTREGVLREIRRGHRRFPRRLLLIAPGLESDEDGRLVMRRSGYVLRKNHGWSSSLLDLRQSEEMLLERFSARWKRGLKTALQRIAESKATISEQSIDWLVARHEEHQKTKGFRGPSSALVRNLYRCGPGDFLINTLELDGEPVAALATVRFGAGAEYYIGWNSERGRKLNSGQVLLWNAIKRMKSEGATLFDLGGYGGLGNPGFNALKKGMGGRDYTLAGEWVGI